MPVDAAEQQIRDDCVAIWRALVPRAPNAERIGYHALAGELGIRPGLIVHPERLGRIHHYCFNRGWAPLNALVINVRKRRPGNRYFVLRCEEGERGAEQDIIAADWVGVQEQAANYEQVPAPEDFANP